jgi:hypothetical protein
MDLRWWEWSYVDAGISGMTVRVAKTGGGTVGKSYEGEWEFEVLNPKGEAIQKSYISTGTPKTHVEACREVLSFYQEDF